MSSICLFRQLKLSLTFLCRLGSVNKAAQQLCDTLPATIMTPLAYATFISLYRDVLAEQVLRTPSDNEPSSVCPRKQRRSADFTEQAAVVIGSPILSTFHKVLDDHLLLNFFRELWMQELKVSQMCCPCLLQLYSHADDSASKKLKKRMNISCATTLSMSIPPKYAWSSHHLNLLKSTLTSDLASVISEADTRSTTASRRHAA